MGLHHRRLDRHRPRLGTRHPRRRRIHRPHPGWITKSRHSGRQVTETDELDADTFAALLVAKSNTTSW